MKAVLIDLDGVIYDSKSVFPHAADSIEWLNQNQIPYLFVTNTTSKSLQTIIEKLAGYGIETQAEQILTPLTVAQDWLRGECAEPIALFLTENSKLEFAEFEIYDRQIHSNLGAVLIGDYGELWSHETLNHAFRLLMLKPKPKLVALGMSRYWHAKNGLELDVGPYIKALQFASNCETIVMGKPSPSFFSTAVAHLNLAADQVMMIGDDLTSDINAAQNAGLKATLVKTGKFLPDDLNASQAADWVIDSIADLPQLWKSITIR